MLFDGGPVLEVIRIGAAGAGVEQFKECSFPGRAVIVARAAKSGWRECGEGAAIERRGKEGMVMGEGTDG
jgi:hypothetical protein